MKFAMITFAASVGSSAAEWTPAVGYCSNVDRSINGGGVFDGLGTKESCSAKCSSLDNCVEGYFCAQSSCGGLQGYRCYLFGEGLSDGVGCGAIVNYPNQYPFTNDNFGAADSHRCLPGDGMWEWDPAYRNCSTCRRYTTEAACLFALNDAPTADSHDPTYVSLSH